MSDGKFSLRKNDKVDALVLEAMPSHKVVAQPTHAHELAQKPTITHEEEKIALILFITGGFAMWFMINNFTKSYQILYTTMYIFLSSSHMVYGTKSYQILYTMVYKI